LNEWYLRKYNNQNKYLLVIIYLWNVFVFYVAIYKKKKFTQYIYNLLVDILQYIFFYEYEGDWMKVHNIPLIKTHYIILCNGFVFYISA